MDIEYEELIARLRADFEKWAVDEAFFNITRNAADSQDDYWDSETDHYWEGWKACGLRQAACFAELEREMEEMTEDAERYRWLKENNDKRFVLWDRCSHELAHSPRPVLRLDDVIDAQRKQKTNPTTPSK